MAAVSAVLLVPATRSRHSALRVVLAVPVAMVAMVAMAMLLVPAEPERLVRPERRGSVVAAAVAVVAVVAVVQDPLAAVRVPTERPAARVRMASWRSRTGCDRVSVARSPISCPRLR